MNLQENIQRIKSMMGVINESKISLPKTVNGSYTAGLTNCDRLHAFNDTGSGSVGKMNDIVNPVLISIYNEGINPDITDVSVTIDKNPLEYVVNWSVTIDESKDGKAYTGIYSRGHGGKGKWVFTDVSTSSGHASIDSCKTSVYIKKRGTVGDMVLVKDYEYNKDGKLGCQVNQLFYKYELKEYPSKSKPPEDKKTPAKPIEKYISPANVADKTNVVNKLKK
jgi:hypothetical protein